MKDICLKVLNYLIPKKRNAVFFMPLSNCEKDKYDLINHTADSALSFVNYWLSEKKDFEGEIYLVIHFRERLEKYKEYIQEHSHIKFHFVYHGKDASFIDKLKVLFCRFRCKVWVTETISYLQDYATKSQAQICLTYFTSCKGDYVFQGDTIKIRKWCLKHQEKVRLISSSFVDSLIRCTAFGTTIQCLYPLGLNRNDNFDSRIPINNECKKWVDSLKHNESTKVILYAPTFRDYESSDTINSRSIWGFGYNDAVINEYLKERNYIVIAKLHPWQNAAAVNKATSEVVLYKENFEFSFYDVMKASDMMITDYSSIGLDWLLLDKPIIYNLYDYDKYKEVRGFAYEPYSDICGGPIVNNSEELLEEIDKSIINIDYYAEKRASVLKLMYSGKHFDANEKIFEQMKKLLLQE